jgi:hypothetical protein
LKKNRIFSGLAVVGALLLGVYICAAFGLIGYNIHLLSQDGSGGVRKELRVQTRPDPTQGILFETGQTEGYPTPTTLELLENEVVPINDPMDLAIRLGHKDHVPLTKPVDRVDRSVGERERFWVTNVDTAENFHVDTILSAVTDHAYFWIEEDVEYSEKALKRLAQDFEKKIYPTNHAFFGTEWTPGVDEDPHLYIIYARGLGGSVAGYFSSVDEYHPSAHAYSNAHETFMLNADNVFLSDLYTYGVLAHEFQHMIHWYRDRNETSWLNEGFSELATLLNGYRLSGGFDTLYARAPDLQLNDWPNDPSQTVPHYGASFLFVTYFLDRFGNEATQALVADDLNGLSSVDRVLEELNVVDPSGDPFMDGDDFFLDWVITNFLKDEYTQDSRYQYHNYPKAPSFQATESFEDCPTDLMSEDVHQYGVDYIQFRCDGRYTLTFEGQETVRLLPENPYSGKYAYWSNKGDQSDMTLTKEFDFRDVDGPLTLRYWTWYDIEEDYDYLYLEASTDGDSWTILKTPSGTDENPSGNSYGWAYNGLSNGDGSWILEEIDISTYAGKKVKLRFEYITDAAVNGEGFLIDDLAIPEIDYAVDFEEGSGGWEGDGFVRVQNQLPQTYRLALIQLGRSPGIQYLTLSGDNQLSIPLHFGTEVEKQILVVTGTTRFTRQKADYKFQIINPGE